MAEDNSVWEHRNLKQVLGRLMIAFMYSGRKGNGQLSQGDAVGYTIVKLPTKGTRVCAYVLSPGTELRVPLTLQAAKTFESILPCVILPGINVSKKEEKCGSRGENFKDCIKRIQITGSI